MGKRLMTLAALLVWAAITCVGLGPGLACNAEPAGDAETAGMPAPHSGGLLRGENATAASNRAPEPVAGRGDYFSHKAVDDATLRMQAERNRRAAAEVAFIDPGAYAAKRALYLKKWQALQPTISQLPPHEQEAQRAA